MISQSHVSRSITFMTRRLQHAAKVACFLLFAFLVLTWTFYHRSIEAESLDQNILSSPETPLYNAESKRLVVASIKGDDTTWLSKRLPDWPVSQYVADDPKAKLTVPRNKGRESMVYLTYIIDNYDRLADVTVFIHSLQYQWHNDDPNKDGANVISRLQLPYVREQGYVNIRCVWSLGCPAEVLLDDPQVDHETSKQFRSAFIEIFPERAAAGNIPSVVAASCCSQFAVTASKLREKPRSEYERLRNWIIKTSLDDDVSGRVLEYSWHMIFGRPDVHCPDAKSCYCNVFGLCDLQNCEEGACEGRYTLPPYSSVPVDWAPLPEFGQD